MPFAIPSATSFSLQRPMETNSPWVRPSDWPTITDTAGEIQFLVSDLTIPKYRINTTFTRSGATGNIYIDWGDGITDTISTTTATNTSHTYSTGGTPCSLGYNTWKIRIYRDSGVTITSAVQQIPNPPYVNQTNLNPSIGMLEAVFGDGTITTAQALFQTTGTKPFCNLLQYCKLPATMSTAGDIFSAAFLNCYGLAKVVLPTSAANATSLVNMFANCVSLQEITFPQNMTAITTMATAFGTCTVLKSITLPPTLNSVTTIASAFSGCTQLSNLEFLPALPACTSYNAAFANMRSLLSARLKSFRTAAVLIDFTQAFSGCTALESVVLPDMFAGSTINFTQAFSSCPNLKSFIAPLNFSPTTLNNAFSGCSSMSSCVLPASMSLCTDMQNCFINCNTLQSFTFPTTIGASCNMQATFSGCSSLSSMSFPAATSLSNFYLTFSNCFSLVSVSFLGTVGGQFRQTFQGCLILQYITLPTNTTNSFIESIFNGCQNLRTITIPGATIATTSFNSAFNGCLTLQTATLPATASSATVMAGIFTSCVALQNATLPATVGAVTTYASTFQACYNVRTVVLPTTQTTTVTTMSNMFNNCYSLTSITNLDKIGDPDTSAANVRYVDGTAAFYQCVALTSIDMYCKFSKFEAFSTNSAPMGLTSLRLRNNGAGQYGGTSPQINLRFTSLGQAALVQVFNDLPTVTGKTIDITSASGASSLTAPERAIATGKGWTITG